MFSDDFLNGLQVCVLVCLCISNFSVFLHLHVPISQCKPNSVDSCVHTQATFLQPLTASTEALAAANPSLAAMLEALNNEDLERKCRCVIICVASISVLCFESISVLLRCLKR